MRNMRKKMILLVIAVICVMALSGCKCKHQWQAATCDTPQTCAKCNEVSGVANGHKWQEATCTVAKTCKVCGLISGEPLGHAWMDATCTTAKTCTACGETEGEALEHTWQEANYQQAKTCTACGETEGEAKAAFFEENNLKIQTAELGKDYTVNAGGTPFIIRVESYDPVTSSTYEAADGYEWKKLVVRVSVEEYTASGSEDQKMPLFMNTLDFYEPTEVYESLRTVQEENPKVQSFQVNYCGKDYSKCLMVYEGSQVFQAEAPATGGGFVMTTSFRIPQGYDGIVLFYGDGDRLEKEYEGNYEKLFTDENTLFLHLN